MAKKSSKVAGEHEQHLRHPDPYKAAQELDALLYFIHNRYSDNHKGKVPNLGSFLIFHIDVVFTEKTNHVVLRKNPSRRTLEILTPPVPEDEKDRRRIFLLNEFGELLSKCQKQAYMQIQEMLLKIMDPEARDLMIEEFENYRATLARHEVAARQE